MKTKVVLALVFLLALTTAGIAGDEAKTVTVTGSIACAKCTLKMAEATDCQSVLVVEGKQDAAPMHYYLVKNDVTEEFGHVCQGEKAAKITGTVLEKDGKLWLTATKMKAPKQA